MRKKLFFSLAVMIILSLSLISLMSAYANVGPNDQNGDEVVFQTMEELVTEENESVFPELNIQVATPTFLPYEPLSAETEFIEEVKEDFGDEIQAELDSYLYEINQCTDKSSGYFLSKKIYQGISGLYDRADAAMENGEISEEKYDSIMELIGEMFPLFFQKFTEFGFDPYAAQPAYDAPLGGGAFPEASISASWNGSNIIVNFHIKLGSNFDIWHAYLGWTGELLHMYARGEGGKTPQQLTSSNFGTVTYTEIKSFGYWSVNVTGYITITDPVGFANWYYGGNHALFFTTYTNTGSDTYFVCSDHSPIRISNADAAINASKHTHSWAWTSNSTAHWEYCTSNDGATRNSGSHNSNVTDHASVPGYTVQRCSVCNAAVSSTPNQYAVILDNTDSYRPGTENLTVVFHEAMPAITVPYRTGCEFDGYYSEEAGNGTRYYNSDGTSAHVYDIPEEAKLFPNWIRKHEITVTDTAVNDFVFLGA